MANSDIVIVTYAYRAPYASELTGFKPGVTMTAKHPLSGSDQGVGSKWVVKEIEKDGNVVFYPLEGRGINPERSRPLTGLIPYAAGGLHTTKSYFEPLPVHTNAII
jgi:hypothetical protein